MTLATVPRYDPDRVGSVGGRAVVVGGGLAGLCAARVLADGFEAVTVLERDPVPEVPAPRRGVPQGRHIHVLLEAGRATLGDLFDGFAERLLGAGGVVFDVSLDFDFYVEGGFTADSPRRRPAFSATRPLFEHVIRERLRDRDDVGVRSGASVAGYRTDGDGTAVTGVDVRFGTGEAGALDADLVVDATGRTSRTPAWLEAHGYRPPPTDDVHIDMAYSSTTVERPPGDRRGVAVVPSPGNPRGGVAMPVEGDRWVMTLWGMHGAHPPTDPDGFRSFAELLPVAHLQDLLRDHAWADDDVAHYPFGSTRRRRYEALDRFPDGLVVVGDAIASFNPIYGQGMSVGALEAVSLHHALADGGLEDLGPRFFGRAARTVDHAWTMAVTSDHQFAETTGPRPAGTGPLTWYLARLLRRAHDDGEVFDAFYQVQMMLRPPRSLLRPWVVWRVMRPW